MTDIVERLRSANGRIGVRDSNDYGMTITVAEANAAADEIERLREALTFMQADAWVHQSDSFTHRGERLERIARRVSAALGENSHE